MPPKKTVEWFVDEKGCHICTSHATNGRYPVAMRNHVTMNLHRVIYIEAHGPLPKNIVVRHKCDNTMCVNIEHLEKGTTRENAMDYRTRVNDGKGERHARALLTEKDVLSILDSFEKGVVLAKRFGVTDSTICAIRKKKIWKHLHERTTQRQCEEK